MNEFKKAKNVGLLIEQVNIQAINSNVPSTSSHAATTTRRLLPANRELPGVASQGYDSPYGKAKDCLIIPIA